MKQLLGLVLVCCSISAWADDKKVFVTVDKDNNLVFSDTPIPGATMVDLKQQNLMASPTNTVTPVTKAKARPAYQVVIARPASEETIRENNGTVYVSGQIQPMFSKGLRVKLYLNDTLVAGPSGNANFILHNIDRGEHQLRMEVLNQSGKVIATSPTTTFYLHRASVISPK